jgi:single-strand DNA-binding protein
MRDIATAQLSGNLTREVDLRVLPSGADVARLRVASTTRRRTGEDRVDKTNYFTVEVFGAQARSCAEYLRKGSRVFVDAELDWREWTDQQNNKHEAVTLKARRVLFEDRRPQPDPANGQRDDRASAVSPVASPVAAPDPVAAVAAAAGDDAGSASADELPY